MPPGSPPGLGLLCASISAAVEPVAMIEAPSLRCGSATWMALIVPTRLVLIRRSRPAAAAGPSCRRYRPAPPRCRACRTRRARPPARRAAAPASRTSALRGDDPLAGLLDQPGGLLEVLRRGHRVADGLEVLAEVDRDDVGALFGQPDRMTAALSAGGAGDECDLAFNASHCRSLRPLISGRLAVFTGLRSRAVRTLHRDGRWRRLPPQAQRICLSIMRTVLS